MTIKSSSGLQTREDVYRFILQYKAEHDGIAPSMREIREAVGISSYSHIKWLLDSLEEQGKIKRGDGARYIEVSGAEWIAPASVQTK